MNDGAKKAKGEILVFLHADTIMPRRSLELIDYNLQNYDAGAFELAIDSKHWLLKFIAWTTSLRTHLTRHSLW